MRKLKKKERAEVRKKLAASNRTYRKLINELVDHAHQDTDELPRYMKADITDDAEFSRLSALAKLIEERGRFQPEEANLVIANNMWETKERCAQWLRTEVKLLREGEARVGAAPVRNRLTLSRIEIADLAVTMLESLDVGENLLCLFQELLNVDRHRRELATSNAKLEQAAQMEAQLTLQGLPCGVQELAKMTSVRPSSVTRWRRSDKYRERVEFYRNVWSGVLRDDYFEEIKLEHGALTEAQCFRHAFRKYVESIPARRADWTRKSENPK